MARKVIGPTGSRRRRWLFLVCLVSAALAAAFYVVGAAALTSPSGFESSDGNMALDVGGAVATDWNCFQGTSNFASSAHYGPAPTGNTFTAADCKQKSGATDVVADSQTTPVAGELEQKSGQKFDTACPTFIAGNNPPKDEWTNVAEYTEAATNGDLFFYGATIRPVVNGNTSGNVYFNQGTNPLGATCHVVGDVLIAFDFLNGGGTPSLHSLTWINSPSPATTNANTCFVSQDQGGLCWGDQQAISTSDFNGNVNTSAIAAADNAISGTDVAANAFAEFGINLTQALKDAGISTVPCFANQTWVSRSSGSSFTSNPEDVEIVNRQTCGSITIIKHTLQGDGTTRGVDQSFSYTTSGSGLSGFSLNDKTGTDVLCGSAPCNKKVFSGLAPGSYTVTEGAEPTNFAFNDLSCTATGNGTSALPSSGNSTATASITLGIGGSAVCTYTNQLQLGALVIFKNSTKSGTAVKNAGATFCFAATTGCTGTSGAGTVTDNAAASGGSYADGDSTTGVICVPNLSVGTYDVNETHAPTGYGLVTSGQTDKSVTVVSGTDCSTHEPSATSNSSSTVTFTDPPLADVIIAWRDGGSGETKLFQTMTCAASNSSGTDATTGTGFVTPTGWTTSDAISGVQIGSSNVTVTCTAVIDP